MSRRGRLGSAALGAGFAALALPPLGFWPLGWVGLAPFFAAANAARTRREAAAAGFAAGFVFHAVALHWIYATCRFAHLSIPVALLAWSALAAVLALNWALVGFLGRWLDAAGGLRPWGWALVWTAVAAATERWTPRLGADLLAYTQWPNLSLIQAGSWGGPHLLGFAVCLVNAALAEAWSDVEKDARASVPALAAGGALVAGLLIQGSWVLLGRPADRGVTARVAILQPAIDQYRKWDAAYVREILENFEELLARGADKEPVLVLWPETALPRWQSRGEAAPEAARWAKTAKSEHLVGVVAPPEGAGGASNGLQLVTSDGEAGGFYAKRELVPFGEYIPLRFLVPRFVIEHWLGILDQLGDMSAGARDQDLLPTPFGLAAATICYEAVFPRWARRDAARGARILVNVTNDGWYKDTWGPYQHFQTNVFRAVENRLTVIRSGNTGISAVIDPWGVVTARLPLNLRGRLDADVPLDDPFPARSFYVRHGDWLGTACLALTVLALLRRARING